MSDEDVMLLGNNEESIQITADGGGGGGGGGSSTPMRTLRKSVRPATSRSSLLPSFLAQPSTHSYAADDDGGEDRRWYMAGGSRLSRKPKKMLGTFRGVFVPACIGLVGPTLFLRLPYVIAQAGLLLTIAMIVLVVILSLMAISGSNARLSFPLRLHGGSSSFGWHPTVRTTSTLKWLAARSNINAHLHARKTRTCDARTPSP